MKKAKQRRTTRLPHFELPSDPGPSPVDREIAAERKAKKLAKFPKREFRIAWHVRPAAFSKAMDWPRFSRHEDFALIDAREFFEIGYDEESGLVFWGKGPQGVLAIVNYVTDAFRRIGLAEDLEDLHLSGHLASFGDKESKAAENELFNNNGFGWVEDKFAWER